MSYFVTEIHLLCKIICISYIMVIGMHPSAISCVCTFLLQSGALWDMGWKHFGLTQHIEHHLLLEYNKWWSDTHSISINSLAPGRCSCEFECANFKHNLEIDNLIIQAIVTMEWMQGNLVNGKLTPVHVMAWCWQATSHCWNQCWSRSLSPYGITRPQCVN